MFVDRSRRPNTAACEWWNQRFAGREIAATKTSRYVKVKVLGRSYVAHRVAFLMMTGSWPVGEPDHINLDKTYNRWCNLRVATTSQNQANTKAQRNSKSGIKGVSWDRHNKKWRAAIRVRGVNKSIGWYDNIADAAKAYEGAAIASFGDFARTV